jgi:hypothetical protein
MTLRILYGFSHLIGLYYENCRYTLVTEFASHFIIYIIHITHRKEQEETIHKSSLLT